jgi:DNA replication and repair protein RecF
VLAVGPNGAGKTNLLEAVHVATQGFSPRTRADAQLVRFGAEGARIAVSGTRAGGSAFEVELTLRPGEGKRARLNGAPLRTAEQLRAELPALVFTPDRLVVVKGSPAARRAYFDRSLARLLPGRAPVPLDYAAAVGQRNAALRRVGARLAPVAAVAPWTAQVAELGAALVAAREEALAILGPLFATKAAALGLPDGRLDYAGRAPSVEELEARLPRDLDRGITGAGPHLDDVGIRSGERDLRSFGSQGEQRLAVLALGLAEAEALADRRGGPPLLLFDDVLSELDRTRREALVRLLPRGGQTLMTSTAADALAVEPDQLLIVSPGHVREG